MDNVFELMMREQGKQELHKVIGCNEKTERFGLSLSEEDAKNLIVSRQNTLKETKRVEFGEGILKELIVTFCDSSYINQENYAETITELQNIFYIYKNESEDELTDDELLNFMKVQFEEICCGDLDYLKETCLERYTRAVRGGYQSMAQKRLRDEYSLDEKKNEYGKFSEETRWDYEVYWESLKDTY